MSLSSPAAAFVFFLLIPLLLSLPDPAPWPGFGAVKFVLPPGRLFLEEAVDGGAGSLAMMIARLLEPRNWIPMSLVDGKTAVRAALVPGLRRVGERAGG